MLGRERLRMVEGRRTKRAEARRKLFRGRFESSCRRWFVFRPVIGREWWRQDTWWRTDMRGGRSVGWTGVRSDTGESVGRVKGREGGRADGRVNRTDSRGGRTHGPTADGRTYDGRWDGRAGGPTVDGGTCRQSAGRSKERSDGRTDGRSYGLGHDQSQGSGGQIGHPTVQ